MVNIYGEKKTLGWVGLGWDKQGLKQVPGNYKSKSTAKAKLGQVHFIDSQ
jgi:hypothetical protein